MRYFRLTLTTAAAVLMATAAFLTGCATTGDGKVETRTFYDTPISAIDAKGPWRIEVISGAERNVITISAESNLWTLFEYRNRSEFKIATIKRVAPTRPMTVRIETTLPVREVELDNGAELRLDKSRCDKFEGQLEKASRLTLKNCEFTKFELDLKGASSAQLGVRAQHAEFDLEDASSCSGGEFVTAEAECENASRLDIDSVNEMKVKLSGASRLDIQFLGLVLRGRVADTSKVYYGGKGATLLDFGGNATVRKIKADKK